MPLRVKCPEGHVLLVPERRAGTAVRCPKCKRTVRVPKEPGAPPAGDRPPAETPAKRPAPPPPPKPRSAPPVPPPPPTPKAPTADSAANRKPPIPARSPAEPNPGNRTESAAQRPPRLPHEKPSENRDRPVEQDKPRPPKPPSKSPAEEAASKPSSPSSVPPSDAESAPPKLHSEKTAAAKPSESVPPPLPKRSASAPPLEDFHATPSPKAAVEPDAPQARGVEHTPERRRTAYYLAVALGLTALFGMAPGVIEIGNYFTTDEPNPTVRHWAYPLVFVGLIQLFYVFYLVQVPDWSSVWVVSVFSLLLATIYAMLFVVFWWSSPGSTILNMFQIAEGATRAKARWWSFCMLNVTGLLAYFLGRSGHYWQKTYMMAVKAKGEA